MISRNFPSGELLDGQWICMGQCVSAPPDGDRLRRPVSSRKKILDPSADQTGLTAPEPSAPVRTADANPESSFTIHGSNEFSAGSLRTITAFVRSRVTERPQ